MKRGTLFPCVLLLLAACGDDNSSAANSETSTREVSISAKVTTPTAQEPVVEKPTAEKAVEHKLPFGIPIMPGGRYISGSPEFSKPTKRRGGEAIATIAFKDSVADIIGYYDKVLPELGFEIAHKRIYDESTAVLNAKSATGEAFSVNAIRGGSKSKEGENTTSFVATMPKPEE